QLKATVTAISPLIGGDKKLKDAIDSVSELVQSGYLQSSSSVVEKLTHQLRDLFRDSGKSVHTGYLEMHTERICSSSATTQSARCSDSRGFEDSCLCPTPSLRSRRICRSHCRKSCR